MADSQDDAVPLKVGTKVLIKEKGLQGTVRYVGTTLFAPGKWVGVELNEPKGKNNGVVGEKQYFTCPDMHGLFVRQNQLQLVAPEVSRLPLPQNSGIPRRQSMGQSQGQPPGPVGGKKSPALSPPQPAKKVHGEGVLQAPATPQTTTAAASLVTSVPPPPATITRGLSNELESSGEKSEKSDSGETMADLQQKLDAQQKSKLDEKARLKEIEKLKIQLQQLLDYKMKWSESQTELQQQLRAAKKELKEAVLAKQKAEEEFKDLSDAVEMATLDKEMAEERCDTLQTENDALKEKVEELTIDLELIKSEISEGGKEGAACTFQVKQLEQQNTKLKEALVRLRDISTQDKAEHQRVVKDLDKHTQEINQLKEAKAKMEAEIRAQEALIDELKEQVDAALGAEEMVEKLTDRNLQLEEKVNQLTDTVSDLEALKELSDQQEELRMEAEHDLREELDMSLNSVRQKEKDIESAQEIIVDQQQTIDKFRELVKQLQVEIQELKERGNIQRELQQRRESDAVVTTSSAQSILNLNAVQLRSSAKSHSRTIEFELRKLEAQQALEHINHLKAFMPNSFLATGGDYDALLVLMLLSRLAFKSELIIDQLKQQNKIEEALGSLGTATGSHSDQLAFSCLVVYRLMRVHSLVITTIRVLDECNVQLYRQMGTVRDELALHEKALDHLIDLLKSEKLDEATQLNSIERAISHFENLLRTRLDHQLSDHTLSLLNQSRMLSAGCDLITAEAHRLRTIAAGKEQFVTRLKELESFNNDMRQICKKIRRKVPTPESHWVLTYPISVAQMIENNVRQQGMIVEALRGLYASISKRAGSLTDGESLLTGEVEEFAKKAIQPVVQELHPSGEVHEPLEFLRFVMSEAFSSLDKFLTGLLDGEYDKEEQKTKPESPVALRAKAVKDELSDTEGLRFKLEDRQKDILELKKALRVKVQELGESNLKIGILEKKFETVEGECLKRIDVEKAEALKYQAAMEAEKKKYDNAIIILQKEMEVLERDNAALQKSLEEHQLKKDVPGGGKRFLQGGLSSPASSPFTSRRSAASSEQAGGTPGLVDHASSAPPTGDSILLAAKLDSVTKALNFSEDENMRLKSQLAKAQLESLSPLHIPKRMIVKKNEGGTKGGGSGEEERREDHELVGNRTDQEKMVMKQTGLLLKELNNMCTNPRVIDITAQSKGHVTCGNQTTPKEAIANQLAGVLDVRRRKQKLAEEAVRILANHYPGGLVPSPMASFVSPQFSKALNETATARPTLCAKLNLAARMAAGGTKPHKLVLSHQQFQQLHTAIIS